MTERNQQGSLCPWTQGFNSAVKVVPYRDKLEY